MRTTKVNNTHGNETLVQIGSSRVGQASQLDASKNKDRIEKEEKAANPASGYNVAVSSQARDSATARMKAMEIAKNTPEVREDRVAKIKAQIASGEYKVDGGKVADGILHEAVREHLANQYQE